MQYHVGTKQEGKEAEERGMKKVRQGRGVEGKQKQGSGGAKRPQLWSPFLQQASAQRINTVQQGFFLFLIDIFESVLT